MTPVSWYLAVVAPLVLGYVGHTVVSAWRSSGVSQ